MQIRIQLFILMRNRIRIQIPKIMRIHADPDPHPVPNNTPNEMHKEDHLYEHTLRKSVFKRTKNNLKGMVLIVGETMFIRALL
jgi:hypothetical protein